MKLALVNRSIVRIGALDRAVTPRARAATNALLRQYSKHPRKTWRPCGELVAHWHVSPETGRIECRWSLEEPPADDSLCRRRGKTAMRSRARASRHRVRSRFAQAGRDRAVQVGLSRLNVPDLSS
jgi:hypothetical protein